MSDPRLILLADASGGTLAVPTFCSRVAVAGARDLDDGRAIVREEDEYHLDHRTIRAHDLQQKTPAGFPDRRLSWQLVADFTAAYENAKPGEAPYSQGEEITGRNRTTRVVDGNKAAVLTSLERVVGSEDGRFARALTLNEIGLTAPAAKPAGEDPGVNAASHLPPPEGVAFREASGPTSGPSAVRQSAPSVSVGGVTHFGQQFVDTAQEIIDQGGNAGDISRAILADQQGRPRPPLEGNNLPPEVPRDDPAADAKPAGPDPVPAQNKPAGYVRGDQGKVGTLGTFFTTLASKTMFLAIKDGERIGTLVARHDFQIALDENRRATLGISDEDCAGVSEGSGVEVKGWLRPDTSQAGQDTALPGKDSALRPVIRVPKPDPIDVPPRLPPPVAPGCGLPPKPPNTPPDPPDAPDPAAARASAEESQAAADAAAARADERAQAAAAAAEAAKPSPDAKPGQGGEAERNAAAAAANAARSARVAREAAQAAHEAVEAAASREAAAARAQDAAKAASSSTGATAAIARSAAERASTAANIAQVNAARAAARAQAAADRASAATVRAARAAVSAAADRKVKADRAAREAASAEAKARGAARNAPDSPEAQTALAAAAEARANADRAAIDATAALQDARNRSKDAREAQGDQEKAPESAAPPPKDEVEHAQQDQAADDNHGVSQAIAKCEAEKAKQEDDKAPHIVLPHPDGSRWVIVHEADNSLTTRKLDPHGQPLGGTNIAADGTLSTISDDGTMAEVTGGGGGLTSPVGISDGGTGQTTASGARTALGLEIGTDVASQTDLDTAQADATKAVAGAQIYESAFDSSDGTWGPFGSTTFVVATAGFVHQFTAGAARTSGNRGWTVQASTNSSTSPSIRMNHSKGMIMPQGTAWGPLGLSIWQKCTRPSGSGAIDLTFGTYDPSTVSTDDATAIVQRLAFTGSDSSWSYMTIPQATMASRVHPGDAIRPYFNAVQPSSTDTITWSIHVIIADLTG